MTNGYPRRDPRTRRLGRQPRGSGRVLVLITEVGSHGGIQSFNRTLIEACARHVTAYGGSLSVVSYGDPYPPLDGSFPAGISFSCAGGSRRRFVTTVLRAALRSRPTTIIAGLANFAPLALVVTRLGLADQHVVQLYGAEVWGRLSVHRRLALRRAAMLLSITDATASTASRANDLDGVPVRLLSPVVDDLWLDRSPTPSDRGQPVPAYRLLSVARLDATERMKGIDDVFRAITSPEMACKVVEYVVVGDGTDRPRLEALADELGLRCVRFLGAIDHDELRSEFNRCDVFVMPSTQEGFGIVFLEAMACSKPVVASRSGGIPEVVIHGETGLLVEPGDDNGLIRDLLALRDDPELRVRLGQAGRRRVEAQFTKRHFQTTLDAILNELESRTDRSTRRSVST